MLDNILGDTVLVENLEKTKKTAADIQNKVSEAKITTIKIDKARDIYRPAAKRASLLYFILNQLNSINPIYQFSLKVNFLNRILRFIIYLIKRKNKTKNFITIFLGI